MSNGINGITNNFGSDIENLYELNREKDMQINELKLSVEELKKEKNKTDDRIKKIINYIKEISERLNKIPTKPSI